MLLTLISAPADSNRMHMASPRAVHESDQSVGFPRKGKFRIGFSRNRVKYTNIVYPPNIRFFPSDVNPIRSESNRSYPILSVYAALASSAHHQRYGQLIASEVGRIFSNNVFQSGLVENSYCF